MPNHSPSNIPDALDDVSKTSADREKKGEKDKVSAVAIVTIDNENVANVREERPDGSGNDADDCCKEGGKSVDEGDDGKENDNRSRSNQSLEKIVVDNVKETRDTLSQETIFWFRFKLLS